MEEARYGWSARNGTRWAHWPRGLGDFDPEAIAYEMTGGAAADAAAGSKTPVMGRSPSSPGGSMWTQLFSMFGGGTQQASSTFNAALAQFGQQRQSMAPYVLAGVGLVGVGLLAYTLTRK